MTLKLKLLEKASEWSKGSTFRSFLSTRLLPTIIGVLSCHLIILLLYILLKITHGSNLFGKEVHVTNSVIFGSVHALLTNFVINIIPFSILLALLLTLLSLSCRSNTLTGLECLRLGWASYLLLSIFLVLRFPGALILIPVVQSFPLPYWLYYLALLAFGAVLVTHLPGHKLARTGFLILLLLLTYLPHGLFRNTYHALHDKVLPLGRTSVLFLGLDSARLDDSRPQDIRRSVFPGISHFQSTRKQWRILLGEEPATLYNTMFIPSTEDRQTPHSSSFLERRSASGDLQIAFLLDDGFTANSQTLPLGFSELCINREGIAATGGPAAIPIACWLQNIFAVVEGTNPFSDVEVFLQDTRKALSRNHVVLAHTCYLGHSLSSLEDFVGFDGWRWLMRPPIQFTQVGVTEPGTPSLARRVATYKTAKLLKMASAILDAVEREEPGCSGLLTSDHGQDYGDTSPGRLSSTHGFSASPDCAWIPVIPFGRTIIQADNGHLPYTWDDFRAAIRNALETGEPLRLIRASKPILSAFPYICPPTNMTMQDQKDILSMQFLSKSINLDETGGFRFSAQIPIRNYQKSYAAYQPGNGYATLNPIGDGRYLFEAWDGYLLREKAEIPPQDLPPLLGRLGFPNID